jgi:hypothetical protein
MDDRADAELPSGLGSRLGIPHAQQDNRKDTLGQLKGFPKCRQALHDSANVDRAESQGICRGTDVLGADDRVLKGYPEMPKGAGGGERRDLEACPPVNAMPINAEQEKDRRPGYEGLSTPLGQLLSRFLVFDLDDGIGLQVPASSGMDASLKNKLQNIRRNSFVGEIAATGALDEQSQRLVGVCPFLG